MCTHTHAHTSTAQWNITSRAEQSRAARKDVLGFDAKNEGFSFGVVKGGTLSKHAAVMYIEFSGWTRDLMCNEKHKWHWSIISPGCLRVRSREIIGAENRVCCSNHCSIADSVAQRKCCQRNNSVILSWKAIVSLHAKTNLFFFSWHTFNRSGFWKHLNECMKDDVLEMKGETSSFPGDTRKRFMNDSAQASSFSLTELLKMHPTNLRAYLP